MIVTWLEYFITKVGDLFTFLDSFYVIGTVSYLDFSIVILIIAMLINVYVARGSA